MKFLDSLSKFICWLGHYNRVLPPPVTAFDRFAGVLDITEPKSGPLYLRVPVAQH
jgi:hypothetical protein